MKYKITLNNRTYEVEVQEGNAVLIDEYEAAVAAVKPAAPSAAAASAAPAAPAQAAAPVAAGQQIKAPMPGTVLSVNVAVGQAVKKGDRVAVLEAMKMENE
ncbi:MAG: biotin/lipoyl-binding protein, partial [Clostridia bacterium]|nr:biotin/lipoyl-binding protein [Clostridia bacterium]